MAILGTLGTSIVILLIFAYHTAGYSANLEVSGASSLIIVIATYLIFNPVIEGVRAVSTREHPRLDLEEFTKRIAEANKGVDILDTWTRLLDSWTVISAIGSLRPDVTPFRDKLLFGSASRSRIESS